MSRLAPTEALVLDTFADVFDIDELEHPSALQLQNHLADRHYDELVAQHHINARAGVLA